MCSWSGELRSCAAGGQSLIESDKNKNNKTREDEANMPNRLASFVFAFSFKL